VLDDGAVIRSVGRLLKAINVRGDLAGHPQTKQDIANGAGLPPARINAFMNLGPQKAVHFPLSEIRDILAYARTYARSLSDADLQRSIFDDCAKLCIDIQRFLGDDSADALERALVHHMAIDHSVQDRFSAEHQGTHVLIRFDRPGNIVLSRMDVLPKQPGRSVCRFITRRLGPTTAMKTEHVVDGFMFGVDGYAYSVGRIVGSNAVRSVIASPLPQQPTDMIGLRLGLSALDEGPFAHRIYCRRVGPLLPDKAETPAEAEAPAAAEAPAEAETPGKVKTPAKPSKPYEEWEPLFCSTPFDDDARTLILAKIPDIDDIVALLKEPPKDPELTWGLRIPQGDARPGRSPPRPPA
jgi:hypothetical protein